MNVAVELWALVCDAGRSLPGDHDPQGARGLTVLLDALDTWYDPLVYDDERGPLVAAALRDAQRSLADPGLHDRAGRLIDVLEGPRMGSDPVLVLATRSALAEAGEAVVRLARQESHRPRVDAAVAHLDRAVGLLAAPSCVPPDPVRERLVAALTALREPDPGPGLVRLADAVHYLVQALVLPAVHLPASAGGSS